MPNFTRQGLNELLELIGLDVSYVGPSFEMPEYVQLVSQLEDVSLNGVPALKGIALARAITAAGGAGNFSGVAIRAPIFGLWIVRASNVSGTGVICWVDTNPCEASGGPVLNWSISDAKDVRVSDPLADWFAETRLNNTAISAPEAGYQLTNAHEDYGVFPLFIPPLRWFNVKGIIANQGLDVQLAVRFLAAQQSTLP